MLTGINAQTQGNMGLWDSRPAPSNGRRDFIQNLYWRVLNRAPDTAGWNYWQGQISGTQCNPKARVAAESFLLSTEFKNVRFPLTGTNKIANSNLRVHYAYLVFFGRMPDSAGYQHFTQQMQINNYTEAAWTNVVAAMAAAPEFTNRRIGAGAMPVDGFICA